MLPTILKNFNLIIEGVGFAGQIEQLTLPKLNLKTEDYQLGGLDMPVKMDIGLEPMTCEITLLSYDVNVIKGFGVPIGRHSSDQLKRFIIKGASQTPEGDMVTININISGTWQSLDFGSWRSYEPQKLIGIINVRYYKLAIADEVLVEVDVDNAKRQVDGKNQLTALRPFL